MSKVYNNQIKLVGFMIISYTLREIALHVLVLKPSVYF